MYVCLLKYADVKFIYDPTIFKDALKYNNTKNKK